VAIDVASNETIENFVEAPASQIRQRLGFGFVILQIIRDALWEETRDPATPGPQRH